MAETSTQEKPSLRTTIEEYRPLREKVQSTKLKGQPWKTKKSDDIRKISTELLISEAKKGRTDMLTGLYNLRGLIERLNSEIENSRRRGGTIGVLLLDLDNFKALNNTFGHPRGNEYLKHLAKILKDTVRTVDVVSRPGGDEFVLVTHDQGNVQQAAERLIEAVENDPDGPQYWGNNKITASIGATIARFKEEKVGRNEKSKGKGKEKEKQMKHIRDNLFVNADFALYHAKKEGKNNFKVYKRGMTMPEKEHGRLHTST